MEMDGETVDRGITCTVADKTHVLFVRRTYPIKIKQWSLVG
jgi:hypothetical protein